MIDRRFKLFILLALGAASVWSCSDTGPLPSAPVPILTQFAPYEARQGGSPVTLTAVGDSFVARSKVQWNGSDLPTKYIDAQHLTATIGTEQLSQSGSATIRVSTASPGGGVSDAGTFNVWSNQAPQITSLYPETFPGGTPTSIILQVRGNNFDYPAVVFWNGQGRATQFISPTELWVNVGLLDLLDPGSESIQVKNTTGLTSNIVQFVISSPVPVLDSISSTQNASGGQSVDLHAYGTSFVRSSVVQINGTPLTTNLQTPTELLAKLPASLIANPGSYQFVVVNPPSPGGTSNARTWQIPSEPVSISGLDTYGATAGSSGFLLSIYGAGFSPLSVVRWNGVAKPTVYIDEHRLDAQIAPTDVASPGTGSVTVVTSGANAGTSNSKDIIVRSLPSAVISSIQVLDIPANSLVYDAPSNHFYATLPDTAPANAGNLIAIDAGSDAIDAAVKLGNPRLMTIAPEGGVLWIERPDSGDVRRVDVPSLTISSTASLGDGMGAFEIKTKPGQPNAIAVEKRQAVGPFPRGTVMFLDGNQLPLAPDPFHHNTSFVFDDSGSYLYGFTGESSEFAFHTMEVRPDGLQEISSTSLLIARYRVRLEYANHRVYSTDGSVIDADRHVLVGGYPNPPIALGRTMYVDGVLGRIFAVNGSTIKVFDMNTLSQLASITMPVAVFDEHDSINLMRLIKWGTDGLAFRDGKKIYILRSPLVAP